MQSRHAQRRKNDFACFTRTQTGPQCPNPVAERPQRQSLLILLQHKRQTADKRCCSQSDQAGALKFETVAVVGRRIKGVGRE